MALMERVTTLLRVNLNDMVERAEDPEKLLKQLLLDMENQLLQVKTQVAIAVADQHLLEKKKAEHEKAAKAWQGKAELAVRKNDETLARAALDRSLSYEQFAQSFTQQLEDQRLEAEAMRSTYMRLRQKLAETEAEGELLLTARRRARNGKLPESAATEGNVNRTLKRLQRETMQAEAQTSAEREMERDEVQAVESRFRRLEREDRIEALLLELKAEPRLLSDETA